MRTLLSPLWTTVIMQMKFHHFVPTSFPPPITWSNCQSSWMSWGCQTSPPDSTLYPEDTFLHLQLTAFHSSFNVTSKSYPSKPIPYHPTLALSRNSASTILITATKKTGLSIRPTRPSAWEAEPCRSSLHSLELLKAPHTHEVLNNYLSHKLTNGVSFEGGGS